MTSMHRLLIEWAAIELMQEYPNLTLECLEPSTCPTIEDDGPGQRPPRDTSDCWFQHMFDASPESFWLVGHTAMHVEIAMPATDDGDIIMTQYRTPRGTRRPSSPS